MRDTLMPPEPGKPLRWAGGPRKGQPVYSLDWRIVSNGRRYRVQRRSARAIGDRPELWSDVMEYVPGFPRGGWRPWETRWLWRARRRLMREIRREADGQAAAVWREVERPAV